MLMLMQVKVAGLVGLLVGLVEAEELGELHESGALVRQSIVSEPSLAWRTPEIARAMSSVRSALSTSCTSLKARLEGASVSGSTLTSVALDRHFTASRSNKNDRTFVPISAKNHLDVDGQYNEEPRCYVPKHG
jgi:hypothetical protein